MLIIEDMLSFLSFRTVSSCTIDDQKNNDQKAIGISSSRDNDNASDGGVETIAKYIDLETINCG